jgi:hypothetical protein
LDGCAEGARDLVLAIFRLAVADFLGVAYGHDEPGRPRAVRLHHRADAELFLRGPWAACIGDWIGLPSSMVWAEARRSRADVAQLSAPYLVRVA